MRSRGFTLIELMISMLLGLVVIGGAMGVILANRQSYRTNEGLSQVQESARTAFELLARDVRQAGVTGCNNDGRVANVLNDEGVWWQTWFGLRGFDGTQADGAAGFGGALPNNRVQGTDSIQLQGIEGTGHAVAQHVPHSAMFHITAPTTEIAQGDILMVCDFDHAAIFQVSNYNSNNVAVVHNTGFAVSPGNCAQELGYPTVCGPHGAPYEYGLNSQLARLSAVSWYIGDNGRPAEGGRSLYRRRLGAAGAEEIVTGVTDMQIRYRAAGGEEFFDAIDVDSWTDVNAVMFTLTLQSADRRVTTDPTVDAGRLEREFSHIVTLRNRVP
ncbi:prepilin-type N-terminal cleavage/methylation domain-containing protein [Steroidobacter sp. S1-65]|uniref:Prepilin-type N-terminal cleavage/methylation domain-containing protein n=1 Tax=Steroidobacter gossypii TaxID=2805490 RepID=A0ABS1X1N4_9GAMM|nr:prepilin-type N-terminal cleavage/methylation domain-containing protein [Steroidobacter gossypii]MBM0107146.1 prepilin-type N-terminal cleavage/methylation domain-containing protein [Steroidobacter gossypii]